MALHLKFQGCDQLTYPSRGKHWISPFSKNENRKKKSPLTSQLFESNLQPLGAMGIDVTSSPEQVS